MGPSRKVRRKIAPMATARHVMGTTVMVFTRRLSSWPRRCLRAGSSAAVGDEHRLAGLQGALELGIAVHVHHVVPDARVLVARDQAHRLAAALHQEDGAAVEAEGLAEAACHGLHDVDEVQGAGDFLEDLDHGQQVPALVLERARPAAGAARAPPPGPVRPTWSCVGPLVGDVPNVIMTTV